MQEKSKIKQSNTGKILRQWLNKVPYGDYNRVRTEMVSVCMVPRHIFANWTAGLSKVPILAQCAINQVSMKYNGTIVFNIPELLERGIKPESDASTKIHGL